MIINNKYNLGDIVYLVTDADQQKRIVTSLYVLPSGILYELSLGANTSKHYDFEMSSEQDVSMKINS